MQQLHFQMSVYDITTKQSQNKDFLKYLFTYLSLSHNCTHTSAHTQVHIHTNTQKVVQKYCKWSSLKTFQPVYHCHRRYVTFLFFFSPYFKVE